MTGKIKLAIYESLPCMGVQRGLGVVGGVLKSTFTLFQCCRLRKYYGTSPNLFQNSGQGSTRLLTRSI